VLIKITKVGNIPVLTQCPFRLNKIRHPLKAPARKIVGEYDLVDREDWTAILEPALCQDSAAVEFLARLLFRIKKAIESGPDGVAQASRALLVGIEVAYLYTDAHKAAQKLYLISMTGQLKPQDEPLQLINEAIRRGMVEGEPKM
jgi:hypothetical protein